MTAQIADIMLDRRGLNPICRVPFLPGLACIQALALLVPRPSLSEHEAICQRDPRFVNEVYRG